MSTPVMNEHVMAVMELDDGGSAVCRGCRQYVYGSLTETPPGECPTPYKSPEQLLAESVAREVDLVREVAMWKANHANLVERTKLLRERPDLPVDRLPAYKRLGELQDRQAITDRFLFELVKHGRLVGWEPVLMAQLDDHLKSGAGAKLAELVSLLQMSADDYRAGGFESVAERIDAALSVWAGAEHCCPVGQSTPFPGYPPVPEDRKLSSTESGARE